MKRPPFQIDLFTSGPPDPTVEPAFEPRRSWTASPVMFYAPRTERLPLRETLARPRKAERGKARRGTEKNTGCRCRMQDAKSMPVIEMGGLYLVLC